MATVTHLRVRAPRLEDLLRRARLVELEQKEIRARLRGDYLTALDCKMVRLKRLYEAQAGRLDEEPEAWR